MQAEVWLRVTTCGFPDLTDDERAAALEFENSAIEAARESLSELLNACNDRLEFEAAIRWERDETMKVALDAQKRRCGVRPEMAMALRRIYFSIANQKIQRMKDHHLQTWGGKEGDHAVVETRRFSDSLPIIGCGLFFVVVIIIDNTILESKNYGSLLLLGLAVTAVMIVVMPVLGWREYSRKRASREVNDRRLSK